MEKSNERVNNDRNVDNANNKDSNIKLMIFSLICVVISVLIFQSPYIKLNLTKPIKAQYLELADLQPFEGKLAPNDFLSHARYIAHKKLVGPETIVFNPKDGHIYTGLKNGQIVKIDQNGQIHKIAQIGTETNETICNDFYSHPDHNHPQANAECGRPLGLRINSDGTTLYVADAYYGILSIDLVTGGKKLVFSSNDRRLSVPLKFANDLDLNGDIIYFTDASHGRSYNEVLDEVLEGSSKGRLFSFNQATDEIKVLAENLYFPNGLQLTPEKDALLINENPMARILKFYLTGGKVGKTEVFVNLPGFGDTLRSTDKGTLMVPIAIARNSWHSNILDLTGKYPFIRQFLGYFINFHNLMTVTPKYGLLLEYDMKGNLIKSWHDPTGKTIDCITNAAIGPDGKVYLGSFYNDFIAVVDY
jgi:sugar lactone lactonase YvrE